jgi:branched-chain amino acid transport system substrate-binding protein
MLGNRRLKVALTAIAVAAVALAAWIASRKPRTDIRIGVILSLTGDVGPYGQRSLRGLSVAEQEINAAGGINGKPVSLIVEDAKSSPRDSVSALQKLTSLHRVRIVVGDVLSGTTLAMAPIAESGHVLLFAPGASNPSLRNAGDYIFRNWVSDDYDGKVMAHYLIDSGIHSAFILYQQTDYALGLADAFQSEFEKLGGQVQGREGFVTEATDFRAQLLKLQKANSPATYLVGESRQNGTILRQAREMGMHVRWFANLTVDTPECEAVAGKAREGVVYSTPAFDPNSDSGQVKRFIAAYRHQYGEDPDVTAGVAYDALMILASVIREVGPDADKVKDGLYKVKGFPGVTGITTFDDHGDVVKDIFVKEIRDDKPVLIKTFAF